MNTRMKLLVLFSYPPHKMAIGGVKRMYELLKFLSRDNEVHLVYLNQGEGNVEQLMDIPCMKYEVLLGRKDLLKKFFHKYLGITPYHAQYVLNRDFIDVLMSVQSRQQFDAILVEHTYMGIYAPYLDQRPLRIMIDQELNFRAMKRRLQLDFCRCDIIYSIYEYFRLKRFESKLGDNFHFIYTITPEEKLIWQKFVSEERVGVYPHIVDTTRFIPHDGDFVPKRVIFVGDYNHPPNWEGMQWFYKEVFLNHRKQLGKIEVTLVGPNQPPEFETWRSRDPESIRPLGFVEELCTEISTAAVMINPMVSGGGMRGKVLEAMAAGKAVLSTTIGAEGLSAKHGTHIIIADTPVAFARELRWMLDHPQSCREIGNNARAFVISRFDREKVLGDFCRSIRRQINERRKATEQLNANG